MTRRYRVKRCKVQPNTFERALIAEVDAISDHRDRSAVADLSDSPRSTVIKLRLCGKTYEHASDGSGVTISFHDRA